MITRSQLLASKTTKDPLIPFLAKMDEKEIKKIAEEDEFIEAEIEKTEKRVNEAAKHIPTVIAGGSIIGASAGPVGALAGGLIAGGVSGLGWIAAKASVERVSEKTWKQIECARLQRLSKKIHDIEERIPLAIKDTDKKQLERAHDCFVNTRHIYLLKD